MEIKVVNKTDRELVLEIYGEDHTLGNLLAKEALKHPGVEYAAYRIPHPLRNYFEFTLIVKPGADLGRVLKEIVGNARSQLEELKQLISSKVLEQ